VLEFDPSMNLWVRLKERVFYTQSPGFGVAFLPSLHQYEMYKAWLLSTILDFVYVVMFRPSQKSREWILGEPSVYRSPGKSMCAWVRKDKMERMSIVRCIDHARGLNPFIPTGLRVLCTETSQPRLVTPVTDSKGFQTTPMSLQGVMYAPFNHQMTTSLLLLYGLVLNIWL